jgi:hypothetical protein
MQSAHDRLLEENSKLEEKLDYLENQSRRSNLLFYGIPEADNENWDDCEKKVMGVIKGHLKIAHTVVIERAHRVGSAIIARFLSLKDRDLVLSKAKHLKGSDIYIKEDVSKRLRQKQAGLRSMMTSMREDGKRAMLSHDKLKTEEGTFTFDLERQQIQKVDDIHLPPWNNRRHSQHRSRSPGQRQGQQHHQQHHHVNHHNVSRETSPTHARDYGSHELHKDDITDITDTTSTWARVAQGNDRDDSQPTPVFTFGSSSAPTGGSATTSTSSKARRDVPYSRRGGRGASTLGTTAGRGQAPHSSFAGRGHGGGRGGGGRGGSERGGSRRPGNQTFSKSTRSSSSWR